MRRKGGRRKTNGMDKETKCSIDEKKRKEGRPEEERKKNKEEKEEEAR